MADNRFWETKFGNFGIVTLGKSQTFEISDIDTQTASCLTPWDHLPNLHFSLFCMFCITNWTFCQAIAVNLIHVFQSPQNIDSFCVCNYRVSQPTWEQDYPEKFWELLWEETLSSKRDIMPLLLVELRFLQDEKDELLGLWLPVSLQNLTWILICFNAVYVDIVSWLHNVHLQNWL